ncbi:MAG: hypothetical protein H0X66_19115 [Verrucomicrobia bacterium]|nr:hypothetical protein [Verrucomicrobiota bacterium]
MKFFGKSFLAVQLIAGLLFVTSVQALTVEQIRKMPDLTPEKFASLFSDFKFRFHDEVQDFQTFLSSKSGDCDDYATLAAEILSERGYTPRLIAVRMKGETHVVCYIQETGSYLDYNFRKDAKKLVPSSHVLTDIARSVADSFSKDWIATYEFTFSKREKVKRLVNQIIYPRQNPA